MRYKFIGVDGKIGFGDCCDDAVRATGRKGRIEFDESPIEGRKCVYQGGFIGSVDPVIKQPYSDEPLSFDESKRKFINSLVAAGWERPAAEFEYDLQVTRLCHG